MGRNRALSEQLRRAIKASGKTRYRIGKETGIDPAVLCRFMQGKVGLSIHTLDLLGECLGLRLVADAPQGKKG